MRADSGPIIAEPSRRIGASGLARRVFVAALLVGGTAAVYYARQDLTLSHYDARAHLLVARRIVDSLTPGWRQIGAVWLPLPHLLSAIPVQWDWAYRTGYPIVLISVAAMAAGLAAVAAFIMRRTGSLAAAVVAPALVLLNPNVLYLQSTPMTEPLLIGLTLLSFCAVAEWTSDATPARARRAGWLLFALMWTRYEGWCVAIALVTLAAWARWREHATLPWRLAIWCAAAVGSFVMLSWASTGRWFVTSGFFTPDNPAFHRPLLALTQVTEALVTLASPVVLLVAIAGVLWSVLSARRQAFAGAALPVALLAAAALPWFAFYQGHPIRVRYMIPLIPAAAVLAAVALAQMPRRLQKVAGALLVALACWQRPPLDRQAPMVQEAQWETPFRLKRGEVTRQLIPIYDGTPILASMGSLGHYMQESSHGGFDLRSFVHEGNGDLWQAALAAPRRHVRWILMEERAEGGDMIAALARSRPELLDGFSRAAEGGGLVLYRRTE